MHKVKALKNAGCSKFRMLKKGRTTEVEEINEELNRLWKSGAIEIDGKSYNKEKETGYEKKEDEVKADKSEPETETPDPSSDDNTEPEAPEENEDAQSDEAQETENTDPEGSDDKDPEGSDEESSEEDNKEGESSEEDNKEGESSEEDNKEGESSEEGVEEYIKSKPAGFFSEDTLDTYNLDQLKAIGSEMGLDVRSRKKGIRMITELVEKVLSE